MGLRAWEKQALDSIEGGLAGSAAELASLLATFSRLAAGEEMPERAKVRALQPHRPRRRLRRPGGGKLHRDARRLRLGRQRAWPLALWLVVSLGMIAVALVLSRGGPAACTQPWGVCAWQPAALDTPIAARNGSAEWHGDVRHYQLHLDLVPHPGPAPATAHQHRRRLGRTGSTT